MISLGDPQLILKIDTTNGQLVHQMEFTNSKHVSLWAGKLEVYQNDILYFTGQNTIGIDYAIMCKLILGQSSAS